MAIKKRKTIAAAIPTASMADIAFLLIVFFMVTTKFDVDRTRVTLPKSEIRSELPRGSAFVVIYKVSGVWGFKFSDGEQTSHDVPDLSALEADVASVASIDSSTPFVIKAQADTPYQNIDDVMDMLRQSGVTDIVLLTEQRTVNDK